MTDLNTIIIFESDIVIKEISEIMISNGLSAIQYLDLSECSPELIMSNKPDLIIIEIGEEDIDYKRKCLDSIVGKAPILLILNEINPVYNELFKINIQNLYFMTKPLDAVCFRNYIRLTKRIKEMEQKADAHLKTVEALEKSEANLRAIFDNTMQSFIFIGVDFKIKAFNIKASKMISLLTDEPLKTEKTVLDYLNTFENDGISEMLQSALNGNSSRLEKSLTDFEGNEIFCEIYISPIYEYHEKIEGIFINIIDITHRKMLELSNENTLREHLDTQRKYEVEQILATTSRIASIGVIAGGITHEISQPLNAIKVGADGLLLWKKHGVGNFPEYTEKIISGIADAADRIAEIIKHMRSFWIDSDNTENVYLSLNESIDKAMSLITNRIAAHEISLMIDFDSDLPKVLANEVRLELVINNLIINAINSLDKTDNEDKYILIKTYSKNKYACLSIIDNGIGLSNVPVANLFDPLFSTGKIEKGTGLGLAIVKMFLDGFDASISAKSGIDGGAQFEIIFNTEPAELDK